MVNKLLVNDLRARGLRTPTMQDALKRPNVCKERTTVGPLGLRPSRKETSDPGVYMLTGRACVNVAIGRRRACHKLTSDGTAPTPT